MEFTKKAQTALSLAEKASKKLHQNYIGTEHILLGLYREETGVAARLLREKGLKEEKLLEMVQDFIAPTGAISIAERDGYSPKANIILEESRKQSVRFRTAEIGTEHILLAIIKDGDNTGVRLLHTLNINIQKLYVDLLAAMGQDPNLAREDLKIGRASCRERV